MILNNLRVEKVKIKEWIDNKYQPVEYNQYFYSEDNITNEVVLINTTKDEVFENSDENSILIKDLNDPISIDYDNRLCYIIKKGKITSIIYLYEPYGSDEFQNMYIFYGHENIIIINKDTLEHKVIETR